MNFFSPFRQESFYAYLQARLLKIFLIMKLIAILIFAFTIGVFASGKAQNVTLNLRKTNLENVFVEVTKQTNLRFFYDENLIKNKKSVSINVNNLSISHTMDRLLKGQNLDFQVLNGTIVIKEKKQEMVTLKGVVSDSTKPMAGVSISVEGAVHISTSSNENGHYLIEVPIKSTVSFSHVGYSTKRILAIETKEIDVVLDLESAFDCKRGGVGW